MNSNLFQIEQEYLEIVQMLEENEGELTPELAEALDINEADRDLKIGAYIKVIKQKLADIKMAKDEIGRYRDFINGQDKQISRLKTTILAALEHFGLYGKTGNLNHRVDGHTIYSKKTEAIVLSDTFESVNQEEEYSDVLEYNIKSKFNRTELLSILEQVDNIDYDVILNKEQFKQKYKDALAIEDEDEREAAISKLNVVGFVEQRESLVIR